MLSKTAKVTAIASLLKYLIKNTHAPLLFAEELYLLLISLSIATEYKTSVLLAPQQKN